MRKYFILAVFSFMFAASAAQAEFYRWVDRDGKEFFSNNPGKVPQEYRNSMTKIELDESRVKVAGKPAGAGKAAQSGEHRDKHGRGEEYRRTRAANLRLKLRNQKDEYSLVMKQLEGLDRAVAGTDDKKKKMRGDLEKKKTKIETDTASLKRVLEADLPEEARRADAYPGRFGE